LAEKKRKSRQKKQSQFLIDYDLSSANPQCRRRFYKKLKDPKLKGKKSTQSVFVTNDLEKAKKIHKKASKCGKSSIYGVKKIK